MISSPHTNREKELLKLQTQFETEKKEKENLLLKADNKTAHAWLILQPFLDFINAAKLCYLPQPPGKNQKHLYIKNN